MKIIKISSSYYSLLEKNKLNDEIEHNEAGRPCILVVKLKYKGSFYNFAVPFRSNISPVTPKDEYFALPPNPKTNSKHHHGIQFIKMFPNDRTQCQKFLIDGNDYLKMISKILDENEHEIIQRCQEYLDKYADAERHRYSPNIDGIIYMLSKH